MVTKVRDLMGTEMLTVKESSLISAVLFKMARYKKQLVIFVVDEQKRLRGLITPRRILQTIMVSEFGRMRQPSLDWGDAVNILSSKSAGEVMGTPVSIRPDADIEEALNLMVDKNLYALPVIDKNEHIIGRISIFNLIDHWVRELEGKEQNTA